MGVKQSNKLRLYLRKAMGVVIFILIAVQFVPVNRENSPVTAEIQAPTEIKNILRRSCYDCHSNETIWPWYSKVAPISWLVAKDVREGRRELNFSKWGSYSQKRQTKLIKESFEEIEEGEMPLWIYLLAHRNAKLSENDKQTLKQWQQSQ